MYLARDTNKVTTYIMDEDNSLKENSELVRGKKVIYSGKKVNMNDNEYLLIEFDNKEYYVNAKQLVKNVKDVVLEKEVIWESPQKPVLVLPENVLNFRDKIVIKGRAWLIQEYDAISTPGLVYYSLKPTTISKEVAAENNGKEIYVEKHEEPMVNVVENPISLLSEDSIFRISPNVSITLSTEDGYFKTTNKNLKIQKRTASMVVFSIPFGIPEVAVEVKEKGDIVTKTYRVV